MTQAEFAAKLGIKHPNNVSARLENPYYGKWSISTLKQIAAACDVVLVVWFIPFGRFLKWVTGTPYTDNGLSDDFYNIPTFGDEFELANIPLEKIPAQSERDLKFNSAIEYAQGPNPYDNRAQRAGEPERRLA